MIKRLSFALRLSDGFLGTPLLRPEAEIEVDSAPYHHEYKPGGYFIVTDLAEGTHTVTVRSFKFQTEELQINVEYSSGVPAEKMIHYLMLNPSRRHPKAVTAPSVCGTIPGAEEIYILREKGELKIAEDAAEAGNTSVKLFCSGEKPQLPSVFRIKDKTASHCELVTLSGANGDSYMLGEPLKFSHPRSSAVVPLIKLRCGADGEFFFLIPPGFRPDKESGKIRLNILAESGSSLMQAELSAESKGMTALGEIKMKKGS